MCAQKPGNEIETQASDQRRALLTHFRQRVNWWGIDRIKKKNRCLGALISKVFHVEFGLSY